MLRIHFSRDDLIRTRVSSADPLWETALSLHFLQARRPPATYAAWRRTCAGRLPRSTAMLGVLVPPAGDFADFLTPTAGRSGLDEGVEEVCRSSHRQLRADVEVLGTARALPSWAQGLAAGEASVVSAVGTTLLEYHRAAIAPHWSRIQSYVDGERAVLARSLLMGGVEQFLSGLHPSMRWEDPVLVVPDYPVERDIHLGGRGLTLIPSFFCWRKPVTLINDTLDPVLVYPVLNDRPVVSTSDGTQPHPAGTLHRSTLRHLEDLMGATRAAALSLIRTGCTTSELARHLDMSVATASRHTKTLRNAGLVASRRDRSTVVHSLTRLGIELANASTVIEPERR